MKKFRVFMLAALSILLLSSIVACGTTKVSGEEKTYSNAAKTFSVQLPAEDKGSWKVNKDATDDVLDLSDEKDTINIQTMTTMLMGYKRPDYLARIGRIKATDDVLDMLEDAIEQQTPFISDYF